LCRKKEIFLERDLLGQKARLAQKDDTKFSHQMPPASYDLTSGCNNSTFVLCNLQGSNLPRLAYKLIYINLFVIDKINNPKVDYEAEGANTLWACYKAGDA
jgi:hypothetical protein